MIEADLVQARVEIILNGSRRDVPEGTSVAALLGELELPAKHVAVEVNRLLVPRREHAAHRLAPGDQLEVVTLVGGG